MGYRALVDNLHNFANLVFADSHAVLYCHAYFMIFYFTYPQYQ